MKTIAFVTQKGGSGKSTLCIDLAVAAHQAGARVSIVEMDRQATISDWAARRDGCPPDVVATSAGEMSGVLARLEAIGSDFAFIDTPGAVGIEMLAAIRAADLCIIPARPSPADLCAIRPTLAAIYRQEKRFAFVLNQTPAKSYRARDAARSLETLGVLPDVNIVQRHDHQDAIGAGQGVTELFPAGKAAAEIRRLWRWMAASAASVRQTSGRDMPERETEYVRAA